MHVAANKQNPLEYEKTEVVPTVVVCGKLLPNNAEDAPPVTHGHIAHPLLVDPPMLWAAEQMNGDA